MSHDDREADGEAVVLPISRNTGNEAGHEVIEAPPIAGDPRREIESEHHPEKEGRVGGKKVIVLDER
jgi:hypothetical protein